MENSTKILAGPLKEDSTRKAGETRRARCTLRRSGCARGCGRPRGDGGNGIESCGRERRSIRLGPSRRSSAVSARRGCVSAAGREAGDPKEVAVPLLLQPAHVLFFLHPLLVRKISEEQSSSDPTKAPRLLRRQHHPTIFRSC
eukprot:scaffold7386_cov255-Pinguiococcus_pyrenoidosus.AAC.1